MLEQVIGRGGLEVRIDVGISPGMLNGVIGKCLVKTHSIAAMFTPRQGINKILNFSDSLLRKSLDFLD